MNIYGNGNTKYILLKDNYVIFPKFGAIQAFTIPQFIQKINTDPLNRVLLVYHDKNCLKPYIEGFVNNQKAFEIELSKEQYEEANKPYIENEHLRALIERTISEEEYYRFLRIEEEFKYKGELNINYNSMARYVKYVEYCLDSACCEFEKNIIVYLIYINLLLASSRLIEYVDISRINNLLLASFLLYTPRVVLALSIIGLGKKIDNTIIPYIQGEEEANISKIKEYKILLNDINERLKELAKENEVFDNIQLDYYIEIKRAFKTIKDLDTEEKESYISLIEEKLIEFNTRLEETYYLENYEEEINKILTDSIKDLYETLPQISTCYDINNRKTLH